VDVVFYDLLGAGDAELTPIPNWFELDLGDIYDHLNPRTKQGQANQRAGRNELLITVESH
jgi:hypothetical protein